MTTFTTVSGQMVNVAWKTCGMTNTARTEGTKQFRKL